MNACVNLELTEEQMSPCKATQTGCDVPESAGKKTKHFIAVRILTNCLPSTGSVSRNDTSFAQRDINFCFHELRGKKPEDRMKPAVNYYFFCYNCGFSNENPLQIVKVSLHTSQVAHQTGAYSGFSSMKRLGVFLLPPEWDTSLSQGYSPAVR